MAQVPFAALSTLHTCAITVNMGGNDGLFPQWRKYVALPYVLRTFFPVTFLADLSQQRLLQRTLREMNKNRE